MVVSADDDRAALFATTDELSAAIGSVLPGSRARRGVSAACREPTGLPVAFREAASAVRASARTGQDRPVVFDDLGLVRVLVAEAGGADLAEFVRDTIGALVAYDRQRDGALIATLQAYFAANCSQRQAAESIPVHHKTLRYRLHRIGELTGLNLDAHGDRVRGSLALQLLYLKGAPPDPA